MKKRYTYMILGLAMILLFTLCNGLANAEDKSGDLLLLKTNEFIDIDKQTIKFLFKTNIGAKVAFYFGSKPEKLGLVQTVDSYDFHNGLRLSNLTPGKKYFYKIVCQKDGQKVESKVETFVKLGLTKTTKAAEWARKSVFYEIFVRSFADGNGDGIGDFKGLKSRVSYLKELGVDAVWLMPCFTSNTYHGYDTVDYYNIEPDYGTMQDFSAFIKEAHKNGIKVILDLVINHSSFNNQWFIKSKNGDSKYRDYYVWQDKFDDESGKWFKQYKDKNSGADSDDSYYYGVFNAGMPDLNFRNYQVRQEFKKVAKFWLDKGADGFRLDASRNIDDYDRDVNYHWWQEFNAYVKSVKPGAFLVGENWTSTDEIAPFLSGMDSSFNFPLSELIFGILRGEDADLLGQIETMHKKYSVYAKNYIDTTFLANHDMERTATTLGCDASKERLAASLLFTLPGTPFIYYGEELGQKGTKPDQNIREPFDWYTAAKGKGMASWLDKYGIFTVASDGISVEEEKKNTESLLNYYKKLIKIRKDNPTFFTGNYAKVKTVPGIYAYTVGISILVIHNFEAKHKEIYLGIAGEELLSNKNYKKNTAIGLMPRGTVIIKYNKPQVVKTVRVKELDGNEIRTGAHLDPDGIVSLQITPEEKALADAVKMGNMAKVQEMVDAGGNINGTDEKGNALICLALENDYPEVAEYLLSMGANPNAKDEVGYPALMESLDGDYTEIAKQLLDKGADPNTKDSSNKTILMSAAGKGYLDIIEFLLMHGANINEMQGKDGSSALSYAVMAGKKEVVELLLAKGADVKARYQDGATLLEQAQFEDRPEIVELIKKYLNK